VQPANTIYIIIFQKGLLKAVCLMEIGVKCCQHKFLNNHVLTVMRNMCCSSKYFFILPDRKCNLKKVFTSFKSDQRMGQSGAIWIWQIFKR